MADQSGRRSRNDRNRPRRDDSDRPHRRGGDSRPFERQDRGGRGRDRDQGDERGHRRYRSRSRDHSQERRNRRRSRSPGAEASVGDRDQRRDRDRPKELERNRQRERDGNQASDDDGRSFRPKKTERSDTAQEEELEGRRPQKDQISRQQGQRRRSPSPKLTGEEHGRRGHERNESRDSNLPTRFKPEKPDKPAAAAAPMSFKVSGHDSERGRERERSYDGHRGRNDEDQAERGNLDGDAMDQDGGEEEEDDIVVADDGMDAMKAMMGFSGFDSTKGKQIVGNNVGAVRKEKKSEYRQYMNRAGGFNRPLSPSR